MNNIHYELLKQAKEISEQICLLKSQLSELEDKQQRINGAIDLIAPLISTESSSIPEQQEVNEPKSILVSPTPINLLEFRSNIGLASNQPYEDIKTEQDCVNSLKTLSEDKLERLAKNIAEFKRLDTYQGILEYLQQIIK